MPSIKSLFLILALFLSPFCYGAVNVSSTSSYSVPYGLNQVGPGQYLTFELPGKIGDQYEISINLNNDVYRDISAFYVDDINLMLFKQRKQFRAVGVRQGIAPFSFQAQKGSAGRYYLLVDNTYAEFISKKVNIDIRITEEMTPQQTQQIKSGLEDTYRKLKESFIFTDFDINVAPCGQSNAFSDQNGNVTLCSEIIAELSDNPNAFTAILIHELGHTFLNLWGIPGNNNEDIADEFATYVLISHVDAIENWIKFFEDRDSSGEAENMIINGDRHSLSIQRIRNIRENVQNAEEFSKRWNRLVYPHATTFALKKIIEKPDLYDDPQLATEILKKRSGTENNTLATTSQKHDVTPTISISSKPTTSGCSKDTDCKGERICEKGVCISP